MKKLLIISLFLFSTNALAAMKTYETQITDHKFFPDEINVPAGEKFKLIVTNNDKTAEEFESHDLQKEKMVRGGKKITLIIKALEKGEYKFFGEFHEKTAKGKIIVK